ESGRLRYPADGHQRRWIRYAGSDEVALRPDRLLRGVDVAVHEFADAGLQLLDSGRRAEIHLQTSRPRLMVDAAPVSSAPLGQSLSQVAASTRHTPGRS